MQNRISLLLVFLTMSIVQPLLAVAQDAAKPNPSQQPPWSHGPGHFHMWGDHSGWHFWWFPLMIVFFIVFFSAMRYWGYGRRWRMMHRSPRDPSYSAIEILNERFAKGEIDEKEYKDKKALLAA